MAGVSSASVPQTVGVLLAGGLARRMGGGDKPLKQLGGRPLLDRAIDRARPQVDHLILNANGDPDRFAAYGLPVVADVIGDFAGPLAGILTGLVWAREQVPQAEFVASFATDAPFFPPDLVGRLYRAVEAEGADMACAVSNGRTHPVFALWPVRLEGDLRRAMADEDMRKIDRWTARYRVAEVAFEEAAEGGLDPFFNINRPENLAEAERLIAEETAA